METAIITILFFAFFMLIMAVGILIRRKPFEKRCSSSPQEPCHCRTSNRPDACQQASEPDQKSS